MSLYLGFDVSTQQIKVIATNEDLQAEKTYAVEFDEHFKDQYHVSKGVIADGKTIVSPVAMWLDAIDLILQQMKDDNFPLHRVRGISGSCQQHGSIYWSDVNKLTKLSSKHSLSEQLKDALAYEYSPNWQDHSTGEEGKAFEKAAGSPADLAHITGSRAHFRFTGLQIRKLATKKREVYEKTERVSLVSSFLESVLLGKIASLEEADACGMNVYDIAKSEYDPSLLAVAAGAHHELDGALKEDEKKAVEELKAKLGEINPVSYKSSGGIAKYFSEKYGFSPECQIYKFTGDNLATIVSLPLSPNDCLISLGTSTTVLIVTDRYEPSPQYHLFKHPTMPKHYMGMICYCNGALAREKVRDKLNGDKKADKKENGTSEKKHKPNPKEENDGSDPWAKFNEILDKSHGYGGKIGIYFPLGEIVPSVGAQTRRFDHLKEVDSWSVEQDVVSIVELQTLSCRLRAGPMLAGTSDDKSKEEVEKLRKVYKELTKDGELVTDGNKQTFELVTSRPHRCYYVGGASNNGSIVRKMGSILAPLSGNYRVGIPNACALGGAFKAGWSHLCEQKGEWVDYNEYIGRLFEQGEVERVDTKDEWEEYFGGLADLARVEQKL